MKISDELLNFIADEFIDRDNNDNITFEQFLKIRLIEMSI